MWFLALLVLFNAWANNADFVNTYRLTLGGMPLNLFDGLIVLGFFIALFRPRSSENFVKTERMHPVITWLLVLFALALLGGLIGATYNGATPRQILTALRNFMAAPAAIYLAYFLTANVKSSRRFLHISLVAGLIVSFMIVVFFKAKTETRTYGSLNQARAVMYISAYAGLASALAFYSAASGFKLAPTLILWGVMGACLVGQAGTLSRSDWLSVACGLMGAFLLLPKEQRIRNAIRVILAVPVLAASLYVGLYAGSKVTGKDMFSQMHERVMSMLPGDHAGSKIGKAWDTRLPGIFRELEKFRESPIWGGGFAVQDTDEMEGGYYVGLRHNAWTATLAETGALGFAAFGTIVGSLIVVGRRMVRDRTDQTTVLIGALGAITGCFFIMLGLCTMSFNQVRWGLPLFVVCGVVMRTRAMQLALISQAQAEQAMLEQSGEYYDEATGGYVDDGSGAGGVGQPVFGNWHLTN